MAFDQLDRTQDTRAARLDAELRNAHPRTVIEAAYAEFGDRLALVSTFGAESAVLLHLAAQVSKDIPVLFLDTGMLFGQTLDYRKQLAARLGLTDVRDLRPTFADIAVHDPKSDLWKTDTDACCNIRKVIPLDKALGGFDSFAPADGSSPAEWAHAAGRFRHVYQRAADARAPVFVERA